MKQLVKEDVRGALQPFQNRRDVHSIVNCCHSRLSIRTCHETTKVLKLSAHQPSADVARVLIILRRGERDYRISK